MMRRCWPPYCCSTDYCVFLLKCSGWKRYFSPDSTALPGRQLIPSTQPPSKMMGQPCLVSEAADIRALKVEMPLSLSAIMEWPV